MPHRRDPSRFHSHGKAQRCDSRCPEHPDHPPAFVFYTTVQHEESNHCVGNHCYAHMVDELVTDDTYRVCFECSHVYYTPKDLEEAYHRASMQMIESDPEAYAEVVTSLPAEKISFCQACMHDFVFPANIPEEPSSE